MSTIQTILSHEYDSDNDNRSFSGTYRPPTTYAGSSTPAAVNIASSSATLSRPFRLQGRVSHIVHDSSNTNINTNINDPGPVADSKTREALRRAATDLRRWERLPKGLRLAHRGRGSPTCRTVASATSTPLSAPPKKARPTRTTSPSISVTLRNKRRSTPKHALPHSSSPIHSSSGDEEGAHRPAHRLCRVSSRAYSRAPVRKVNVTNVSQIKESLVANIVASTAQTTSSTTSAYSMLSDEQREEKALAEDNYLPSTGSTSAAAH